MISAIIALTHGINLQVPLEGVETKEQIESVNCSPVIKFRASIFAGS